MRKEKSKSGKVENKSRYSVIEKMLRRKGMLQGKAVKMRNKALFIGIVAIALAGVAIGANANIISHTGASDKINVPDVPHKINYQGYLTDAAGNPITGDLDMTFRIYDNLTGGTQLWSETQTSVHVENGLFNVILGSVNPIPGDVFPIDGSRWLETEIESQILTPRKEIVSVAYAFKADKDNDWCGACTGEMYTCCPDNVSVIGGPGSYIKVGMPQKGYWTTFSYEYDGSMYDTYIRNPCGKGVGCDLILDFPYGNVGVGTTVPQEKLHVFGNITIEGPSPALFTALANPGADAGVRLSTHSEVGQNTWSIMREGTSTDFLIRETFPYPPFEGGKFVVDHLSGKVGIGVEDQQKMLDIRPPQGGYTDLGIRLDPNNAGFVGGTAWDIDNDEGVFEIVEHATCAPEFLNNTRVAIVGNCIGSPYGGNTGIGTEEPNTRLHVVGPIATAVRNVAISSTVTQEDSIVVVTGTATGVTITLPSAVGIKGRQYTIKNMNPNPVTVATTGWELIDSNLTYQLDSLLLGGIGKSITVVSDGTNWLIIAEIK